jgi:hypothetical protein
MSTNSKSNSRVFSGKDFNAMYKGYKFYKTISRSFLDTDVKVHNPKGHYREFGWYFTDDENIDNHVYGDVLIEVSVPDDALVCIENDRFRTNNIIWGDFRDYTSPVKKEKQYDVTAPSFCTV